MLHRQIKAEIRVFERGNCRCRLKHAALKLLITTLVLALAPSAGSALTHCDPPAGIDEQIFPCDIWQTIDGTNAGDGDYTYFFYAEQGCNYTFSFCQQGGSADFNLALSLWNAAGNLLLACDDDTCGDLAEIVWTAPSEDVFLVRISGSDGDIGSYTLAYHGCGACGTCGPPLNVEDSIAPCQDWQTVEGETSLDGDYSYSFSAQEGCRYTFTLCQQGGTGDFDTALSIWDGTGATRLACGDDECGLLSEIVWTAPATETLTLRVGGFLNESGSYTLAFLGCGSCEGASIGDPPRFVEGFTMSPLRPNPVTRAGDGISVRFTLPHDDRVVLELYDIRGRRVSHVPAQRFESGGPHTMAWEPGELGSGVYFVVLTTETGLSVQERLVVLR